jgi:hypothetical protein
LPPWQSHRSPIISFLVRDYPLITYALSLPSILILDK